MHIMFLVTILPALALLLDEEFINSNAAEARGNLQQAECEHMCIYHTKVGMPETA